MYLIQCETNIMFSENIYNGIKINIITRGISCYKFNRTFFDIFIYSLVSDSSLECDQIYKLIAVSINLSVKHNKTVQTKS